VLDSSGNVNIGFHLWVGFIEIVGNNATTVFQ